VPIRESVADVGVEVPAFGRGTQQGLETVAGNGEVTIEFSGAKLDVEQARARIVADPSQ
jgi:hypothetical protein